MDHAQDVDGRFEGGSHTFSGILGPLQAMVDNGDVRLEDLIGDDGADTAADLGRLRQQDEVITARRDLLRTRRHLYPIVLELRKFMVAVSPH